MLIELEYGKNAKWQTSPPDNYTSSKGMELVIWSAIDNRARIGYWGRLTWFELGCPGTKIDPNFASSFHHCARIDSRSPKGAQSRPRSSSRSRARTTTRIRFHQLRSVCFRTREQLSSVLRATNFASSFHHWARIDSRSTSDRPRNRDATSTFFRTQILVISSLQSSSTKVNQMSSLK